MKIQIVIILCFGLIFAACSTNAAPPEPTKTSAPSATLAPTMTYTPAPTLTATKNSIHIALETSQAAATVAAQTAAAMPTKTQTPIPTKTPIPPTPTFGPTPSGPVWNMALAYARAHYTYGEVVDPIDPAIIGPEANYLSLQNYEFEGFCPVFGSLVQGYQVTWLVCGNVQWEDYNPNDIKEWLSDWPDLQSGLEFGDLGPVLLIVEPDGSSYIAWLPIGSDSISVQVNINAELDGSAQAFFDTHLRDTFGRLFRRMLADAGIAVSGVYFADDFSHPGGWPVVQEDELESGYENDGYTMFLGAPDQLLVITPKVYGQVADMRVSADITQLEAGDDNEVFYGVVCRYQDLDNFYMFRINGYGSYSAAKVVNNKFTFFGEKNWFYNPDPMRPPGNVNTLRADCIGETLTFYINDIQVMQVTDPDLSQGTYGVVLGTIKTDYGKVRYDAFLVEQP